MHRIVVGLYQIDILLVVDDVLGVQSEEPGEGVGLDDTMLQGVNPGQVDYRQQGAFDIDGALVGGASLKPDDFAAIVQGGTV